jgi:hypothetical protein
MRPRTFPRSPPGTSPPCLRWTSSRPSTAK